METGAEEMPAAVYARRRLRVAAVRDRWRIDDEWWRREIRRTYYETVLEDGRCVTLFQDQVSEEWYRQRY